MMSVTLYKKILIFNQSKLYTHQLATSNTMWPGVLQSMGSQRVGHDWATELNWTEHLVTLTESMVLWKVRKTKNLKLSCNHLNSREKKTGFGVRFVLPPWFKQFTRYKILWCVDKKYLGSSTSRYKIAVMAPIPRNFWDSELRNILVPCMFDKQ